MADLNVTLTYPNFKWDKWIDFTGWHIHPYNLSLLAAMIENKYNVDILDANTEDLTKEQFSRSLLERKTDVLGISVITNEYANSGLIAAQLAKQADPEIKTVIGGVSAISNPMGYIQDKNVDFVVFGEGEYIFKDLCNFLSGKGRLPEKGIIYKDYGKIVTTLKPELITDLDNLPLPAYHLIDFKKYTMQVQRESVDRPRAIPFARIRTSRGCPFDCCFCEVGSIAGKNSRCRSLENVASEIEWLKKDYEVKALIFDDDNLVVNKKRAKSLFKMMIDRKYDLKWNVPGLAVYMLDDEMLDLMKEGGCNFVNIAIESGNQDVLEKIIHKPLNLKKARQTIEKIKQRDIDLAAAFVIGFPGETWEQIRQTLKFAEDIDIDYVKIYAATPFPNTDLYRQAVEGGYLREDYNPNQHLWLEGWIKSNQFTPEDLKILRAYEWDRINFSKSQKKAKIAKMMAITEQRLDEIRRETLARVHKKD